MENINKLLQDVNVILQKEKVRKEESRKRGERFNMFEMLGVAHYEVTHSKIIASFLNPQGSHGQGDLFLRLFLQTIENNDEINIDTSNAKVYTEYDIGNGRIDILIEAADHGIIIENKVYAGDQHEQLIRYNSYAERKYTNGKYTLYYLTLYGKAASDDSAKEKGSGKCVNYRRISYLKDIISWLQCCICESATMPLIRETLVQYLNHIKQLTNQDMDSLNEKELMDIFSSEENMEIAVKIKGFVDNANTVKKMYFESLKNDIEKLKNQYTNLDYISFPESKKYDDRAIFVVNTGKIHTYIGWSICKYELMCLAEYDSYQIKKANRPKRDEYFNNLGLNSLLNEENDWCRWKYFKYDWREAFDCLKKVVEIVIQHKEKPLSL